MGENFPGGEFSVGGIFYGWEFSRVEFSGEGFSRVEFSEEGGGHFLQPYDVYNCFIGL